MRHETNLSNLVCSVTTVCQKAINNHLMSTDLQPTVIIIFAVNSQALN